MTKCHFHQLFVGFPAQNLAESIAEKLFQTLEVETCHESDPSEELG
jgi:hypothetical protein